MRQPTPTEVARFYTACNMLRTLTDAGFQIYVAGSGSVHLMTGDSHGKHAEPLRENIAETMHVPGMSGGDW